MPTKKEVIMLFQKDDALRFILQRESVQRHYKKVKNVFRMRATKLCHDV